MCAKDARVLPSASLGWVNYAMFSFFRRFFQSKIGLPIFLAFLGLMALAFVASDLGNTNFGGVTNTDRMAVVGGEAIPISDLTVSANNALAQVRQRNPTLTMPEFIAEGSLDEVVKQMIDRFAVGQYGKDYGLRAGENPGEQRDFADPGLRGSHRAVRSADLSCRHRPARSDRRDFPPRPRD